MSITAVVLGTLCFLSAVRHNVGLTSQEVSYFDSQEIPVIPGQPDLYGSIQVGTNNDYTHTLRSNGIPDHAVGAFPNNNNQYPISEQSFEVRFSRFPLMNAQPTCLRANSIIGFATNGVAILSPFDYNSNDLNIDFGSSCQGRTSYAPNGGFYYYAQVPDRCATFTQGFRGHDSARIYGVALDGFPIYGPGSDNKVTNAELDACHGKFVGNEYRYYMTDEWPYVLGCFRGDPVTVQGAPSAGGECKFACNKDSSSNNVPCVDDFATVTTRKPPTTKPTTTIRTTTKSPTDPPQPPGITTNIEPILTPTTSKDFTLPPAEPIVGITDEEVAAFTSQEIIEQNTMARGFAQIEINQESDTLTLISNGIPDHATARYPNDDNPNELLQQYFELTIPRYPEFTEEPTCLPSSGIIGFATNGVALFSPFDADGFDVNINGTFDTCKGRTSESGIYHYSQLPQQYCVYRRSDPNKIYGVALDGFPIYGPGDPPVENEDLDVCHGRIEDGQYRYYMTEAFPYIIGCFRAKPQELKKVTGMPTVPPFDENKCRFACNTDGFETDGLYCESGGVSILYCSLMTILLPILFTLLL